MVLAERLQRPSPGSRIASPHDDAPPGLATRRITAFALIARKLCLTAAAPPEFPRPTQRRRRTRDGGRVAPKEERHHFEGPHRLCRWPRRRAGLFPIALTRSATAVTSRSALARPGNALTARVLRLISPWSYSSVVRGDAVPMLVGRRRTASPRRSRRRGARFDSPRASQALRPRPAPRATLSSSSVNENVLPRRPCSRARSLRSRRSRMRAEGPVGRAAQESGSVGTCRIAGRNSNRSLASDSAHLTVAHSIVTNAEAMTASLVKGAMSLGFNPTRAPRA